jgi:hypothetical protein
MAFRKRLFGPAVLVTGPTTLFTGQAGQSTTLTVISIAQPAAGTAKTVTLSIGADAAGTRFFQFPIAAGVGTTIINVNHVLTGARVDRRRDHNR